MRNRGIVEFPDKQKIRFSSLSLIRHIHGFDRTVFLEAALHTHTRPASQLRQGQGDDYNPGTDPRSGSVIKGIHQSINQTRSLTEKNDNNNQATTTQSAAEKRPTDSGLALEEHHSDRTFCLVPFSFGKVRTDTANGRLLAGID